MDIITLKPSNKASKAYSPSGYLTDTVAALPPDATTIEQPAKNRLGMSGKNGEIVISAAGAIHCEGVKCMVVPSQTQSKQLLNDIDGTRNEINVYLSSTEGFVGEIEFDARKSKKSKVDVSRGVISVPIGITRGKKFSVDTGNKPMVVDTFVIDPIVLSSIEVNQSRNGVVVKMSGAECAVGTDKMETPQKRVMFCSDDTSRSSAYKFKSYLDIRKEQIVSSRVIQFASSPTRMRVSFDRSTRCHVAGGQVCCHNGDDDEICY
jgi:hypothetical protein